MMNGSSLLKRIGLAGSVALLVACSAGNEYSDLDAFMAEKKAQKGGHVKPIPAFKTYEAFTYSATALRSPFQRPVEIQEIAAMQQSKSTVAPDDNRAKEFLEQFSFDSMVLVGSLEMGGTLWGLVKDPEGGVHRVRTGNFVGRNHGRIVEATTSYLAVVEIVTDGGEGWVERPRTMKLMSQ